MNLSPLAVVTAAIVLGVAGQILASVLRLPAIIFLLILGVASGPYGFAIVEPANLGGGLRAIVSAFVAIILFEGALTLRPEVLKQAMTPVRRLITVGAAVTYFGAAVLGHFIADLPWSLAFLFSSLIVVTGPTVIAPILHRIRLLPRLHAVLKSESILIDPVGVFIAVATFQYVVGIATEEANWPHLLSEFLERIGIGTLVGGAAGFLAAALFRLRLFHRPGNEHLVNLGALAVALSAFVVSEGIREESGIMAVIVAGLILATLPIPFRTELETFKEHVTTLGVSILFILLSANLNLPLLMRAGWGEVLLLLGLILVVRPASVFLATVGTDLSWREKAYLSLIAPRGILAAAMSSYFAEQLRERGLPGANRIEMLVFFTIGVTVCLQGGWAKLVARWLRVQPTRPAGVLIVGVNDWSLLVARELTNLGQSVLLLDSNPLQCDTAREKGLAVHEGDATHWETYKELDLNTFGTLVAMTPNDAVNTLSCDAASGFLGERRVLQVISKPVGDSARSRVRLRGKWAMPTTRAHHDIVHDIRASRLRVEKLTLERPTTVEPELDTPHGSMVPLLVVQGNQFQLAAEGQLCPASSVLIGLVPA